MGRIRKGGPSSGGGPGKILRGIGALIILPTHLLSLAERARSRDDRTPPLQLSIQGAWLHSGAYSFLSITVNAEDEEDLFCK